MSVSRSSDSWSIQMPVDKDDEEAGEGELKLENSLTRAHLDSCVESGYYDEHSLTRHEDLDTGLGYSSTNSDLSRISRHSSWDNFSARSAWGEDISPSNAMGGGAEDLISPTSIAGFEPQADSHTYKNNHNHNHTNSETSHNTNHKPNNQSNNENDNTHKPNRRRLSSHEDYSNEEKSTEGDESTEQDEEPGKLVGPPTLVCRVRLQGLPNLPDLSPRALCNPVVVFYCKDKGSSKYRSIGQTEVLPACSNPRFESVLCLDQHEVQAVVYHADNNIGLKKEHMIAHCAIRYRPLQKVSNKGKGDEVGFKMTCSSASSKTPTPPLLFLKPVPVKQAQSRARSQAKHQAKHAKHTKHTNSHHAKHSSSDQSRSKQSQTRSHNTSQDAQTLQVPAKGSEKRSNTPPKTRKNPKLLVTNGMREAVFEHLGSESTLFDESDGELTGCLDSTISWISIAGLDKLLTICDGVEPVLNVLKNLDEAGCKFDDFEAMLQAVERVLAGGPLLFVSDEDRRVLQEWLRASGLIAVRLKKEDCNTLITVSKGVRPAIDNLKLVSYGHGCFSTSQAITEAVTAVAKYGVRVTDEMRVSVMEWLSSENCTFFDEEAEAGSLEFTVGEVDDLIRRSLGPISCINRLRHLNRNSQPGRFRTFQAMTAVMPQMQVPSRETRSYVKAVLQTHCEDGALPVAWPDEALDQLLLIGCGVQLTIETIEEMNEEGLTLEFSSLLATMQAFLSRNDVEEEDEGEDEDEGESKEEYAGDEDEEEDQLPLTGFHL